MCAGEFLHEFYRIEECLGSIRMGQDGWFLQLRHRHYSGSWSQSCVDEFGPLSFDELLDAFTSEVVTWEGRRHIADG